MASLAAMAVPMALAGAGVSAFSSIMQGFGQANALKVQAAGGRYQAQMIEQQAQETRAAGENQAQQLRLKQSREEGRIKAGFGASGFTLAGSPLEVMSENTRLMEQDILTNRYNYEAQAGQQLNQAGYYRDMADSEAAAAGPAVLGGFLGAGSKLLDAGAFLADNYTGDPKYEANSDTILGSVYRFLGPKPKLMYAE